MPGGIDFEIRTKFHPEKPTPEEIDYMKDLDPTLAGILTHKILTIAGEGNETLVKLGASSGCRWGDTALAIYTNSGDNAVSATGLYFHAVLGSTGVKYILKHWLNDPSVGVKPGDVFFCNDPFYLGVHASDMGYLPPSSSEKSLSVLLEPSSIVANVELVSPEVYLAHQEASMTKDYRLHP